MTKNGKPTVNFSKRKFKTSSLSNILPTIMKKIGGSAESRNAASIMRIINHWSEIIGKEFAQKSVPVKITFKYQKDRETGEQQQLMGLKIKTEGALSTIIAMRETIILERLNRLFGTDKFKKLTIEHGFVQNKTSKSKKTKTVTYDLELPKIDDPVLKSRLESLGQAVMNSTQNKQE